MSGRETSQTGGSASESGSLTQEQAGIRLHRPAPPSSLSFSPSDNTHRSSRNPVKEEATLHNRPGNLYRRGTRKKEKSTDGRRSKCRGYLEVLLCFCFLVSFGTPHWFAKSRWIRESWGVYKQTGLLGEPGSWK